MCCYKTIKQITHPPGSLCQTFAMKIKILYYIFFYYMCNLCSNDFFKFDLLISVQAQNFNKKLEYIGKRYGHITYFLFRIVKNDIKWSF